MTIFLWGHAGDDALRAVYRSLSRHDVKIAFYDHRRVLETDIDLTVDGSIRGTITVGDEQIELGDVSAAYIRPFDSRWLSRVQEVGPDAPQSRYALRIEDALLSWSEIAPGLVINRPSNMAANSSKPYQIQLIQAQGFAVPDTLVTTEPAAALEFMERYGTVIYKSVSAARSIVSRLTRDAVSRLDDIRWCPTQFQQHIPGHDYRVHVVGQQIFACEIVSSADDYRVGLGRGDTVGLRRFEVPDIVARRCVALAAALGLTVAGIDLRCTPDGRWFCFEANAVPGFTYYQDACGHRIDDAIAQLLVAGEPSHQSISGSTIKYVGVGSGSSSAT